MAMKTGIAWADHTFSPVWGCTKIGPGCKSCYAETLAKRWGFDVWGPGKPRCIFGVKHWREPIRWNAAARCRGVRRRVFCGSMCDVFENHEAMSLARKRLWPLIRQTPHLDWLLLTKRPYNIPCSLPPDWDDGYPNVWLGVSIENNDYVWRADDLRAVPAAVRFVSYEPALGPIPDLNLSGISWLIFGGESGPVHRPANVNWARSMRDKCREAGVAFFHKQSHGPRPGTGVKLDGEIIQEFPEVAARA